MRTGACLALVTIGAILAFAVTGNLSFLNLHTVGYVLIIVGVVGLYLRSRGWTGRQFLVRRRRTVPGTTVITEERDIPSYVKTNPGTSGVRAGLPAVPTPLDDDEPEVVVRQHVPTPRSSEVVDEYYEE
jgi:hypothetical protein